MHGDGPMCSGRRRSYVWSREEGGRTRTRVQHFGVSSCDVDLLSRDHTPVLFWEAVGKIPASERTVF